MLYSYVLDFGKHEFKYSARSCNYTMLFIIERNMIDILHATLYLTEILLPIGKRMSMDKVCKHE